MSKNPVLNSTKLYVENPRLVKINPKRLEEVAEQFSKEELKIPFWNFDEHLEGNFEDVVDMFFLANTINFAFTDFKTSEKYTTTHGGKEHKGSSGMWAALKNAHQEGIPILDGKYLQNILKRDMKEIFEGNIEIPMLKERWNIFKEVGKILNDKYSGHFYNLLSESNGKLFNSGKGVVGRLVNDFPSFDDSFGSIKFYKRAQLAGGMLYGRFQDTEHHPLFKDVDKLTVFADYVLPKGLRDLKILEYNSSLAQKIDNRKLIPEQGLEEIEIRASTIHVCKQLVDILNNEYGKNVNSLHIDAKLWSEARKNKDTLHHLTKTIAY